MPVPNTTYQQSYVGDGVTTQYSFPFACVETSSIQVFFNGVQQLGNFSVALSLTSYGGTVTLTGGAPAVGTTILIQRSSNLLQTNSLGNNAPLPPATIVAMIDKLTIIMQQLALTQVSLAPGSAGVSAVFPLPAAGSLVGWNATNTGFQNYTPQQVIASVTGLGTGNVIGPAASVVGNLAAFNNTVGQLLEDSGVPFSNIIPPLVGNGNPNGAQAGVAGQRYFDKTNIVDYACTTTGNAAGAVWARTSLPAGTIVSWWSTAAVPAGWVLCNGQNGTPNLIGMLIQGADITGGSSAANAAGFAGNANQATAGATSHIHSIPFINDAAGGGSGTRLNGSNTNGASNQPPVVCITHIMKL